MMEQGRQESKSCFDSLDHTHLRLHEDAYLDELFALEQLIFRLAHSRIAAAGPRLRNKEQRCHDTENYILGTFVLEGSELLVSMLHSVLKLGHYLRLVILLSFCCLQLESEASCSRPLDLGIVR